MFNVVCASPLGTARLDAIIPILHAFYIYGRRLVRFWAAVSHKRVAAAYMPLHT